MAGFFAGCFMRANIYSVKSSGRNGTAPRARASRSGRCTRDMNRVRSTGAAASVLRRSRGIRSHISCWRLQAERCARVDSCSICTLRTSPASSTSHRTSLLTPIVFDLGPIGTHLVVVGAFDAGFHGDFKVDHTPGVGLLLWRQLGSAERQNHLWLLASKHPRHSPSLLDH